MHLPLSYLLWRLVQFIPAIIAILVLSFGLVRLASGDPVFVLAGESGADPAYYEMMRARLGLDKPLYQAPRGPRPRLHSHRPDEGAVGERGGG